MQFSEYDLFPSLVLLVLVLQHMLPNFNECWWDSWVLDVLICNSLGEKSDRKTLSSDAVSHPARVTVTHLGPNLENTASLGSMASTWGGPQQTTPLKMLHWRLHCRYSLDGCLHGHASAGVIQP